MRNSSAIQLPDERATVALAEKLARALPADFAGWTVLFEGDLGAGKSTFARAMLQTLGHTGAVPSPTYTLVEPYTLAGGVVYHVDLYRVSDPGELTFLGFDELDAGLRLVEWADRAPELEETADLKVSLGYSGEGRTAELLGITARGRILAERVTTSAIQPSDEVSRLSS